METTTYKTNDKELTITIPRTIHHRAEGLLSILLVCPENHNFAFNKYFELHQKSILSLAEALKYNPSEHNKEQFYLQACKVLLEASGREETAEKIEEYIYFTRIE